MYFALICRDKPDSLPLRTATRPAHLAYLEPYKDRILVAGPFLAGEGGDSIGSLIVIDLPDEAAARSFAGNDPYALAGLFASVEVTAWRKVIPA